MAWLAVALALGILAAVTAGGASASTTRPPCTRTALQAGLTRGPARVTVRSRVIRPFACDDGWAYAAVLNRRNEGTGVFRARGSRWYSVDRRAPCARREIPRRIRHGACDSN